MTYAADTSVSVEKSRSEIERTLARYGATSFVYGWNETSAVIEFTTQSRRIRFELPMPSRQDEAFTRTPTGKPRSATAADQAWEQAQRSRWRALNLVIKAKLEAVEVGIVSFEDEFLAFTVLPSGETVGKWAGPALDRAFELGEMPSPLALMPGAAR